MSALPLNALRTFERVASRLSFSAAANDLHVTPAAVSSQIRSLEQSLGQPLFNRHGRSISLTHAGATLLPGVQKGIGELTRAVQRLDAERSGGILNVSMLASFMQAWMAPRLAGFYEAHPGIDLRMSASDAPVDFTATDFHAAIRFGRGAWPGLTVDKLLDDWILPVCSPDLLERYGTLQDHCDTGDYPLLQNQDEPWSHWFCADEHAPPPRGPMFDDTASIVAAAEGGLGLGLVRWSLAAPKVERGTLVSPLDKVWKSEFAYYLVTPPHFSKIEKVTAFRDWLLREAAGFPCPVDEPDLPASSS